MHYEQAIDKLKRHPDHFGYALDHTGWYLYILDPVDEAYPEPLAYDLMLNEYRDAQDIPERASKQKGWWISNVKPDDAIERWFHTPRSETQKIATYQQDRQEALA